MEQSSLFKNLRIVEAFNLDYFNQERAEKELGSSVFTVKILVVQTFGY